jgi:arylsulfatase A-like enzyme
MPHYPYVYDANCTVRTPVSSWRLRHDGKHGNTPDTRGRSYAQYFDQVQCVQKRLGSLFAAMKRTGTFDAATIVIHGDHGARIGLTDPEFESMPALSPADYADAYSTLFAIKAPGVNVGVDARMLPLPALMSYAGTRQDDGLSEPKMPVVFVRDRKTAATPFPLPRFPRLALPTR